MLVGEERHDSVDLVLRYLGLGAPEPVAADDAGAPRRRRRCGRALDDGDGRPTVVALQAGNVHSGAFDPFAEAIAVAHDHGAWVHVDGAFGLFAAASPRHRHLVAGYEAADSWATDAHKTLNVPYDCGLAIVRDPAALRAAMSMAGRLPDPRRRRRPVREGPRAEPPGPGAPGVGGAARAGPHAVSPTSSTGWSATRARFADGHRGDRRVPRCSTTSSSPRCARRSATTSAPSRSCAGCWPTAPRGPAARSGTGRAVLRISVSNWSTTADDVERTLAALRDRRGRRRDGLAPAR